MKIQQMALVLVMTLILFSMIATVFATVWLTSLRDQARILGEKEAQKTAAAIAGTPELVFTASGSGTCSSCIDMEKALILKTNQAYISQTENFWNYDYFQIERIVPPAQKRECAPFNFPDCSTITLVSSPTYGKTATAYVTLVSYVPEKGGYFKYEIGRITVSKK